MKLAANEKTEHYVHHVERSALAQYAAKHVRMLQQVVAKGQINIVGVHSTKQVDRRARLQALETVLLRLSK